MPDRVFAQASPRSIGGLSMFDAARIDSSNVIAFTSEDHVISEAVAGLRAVGFEVLGVTATSINIAGPAPLYEEAFGTTLVTEQRETRKSQDVVEDATYIECVDTDVPGLIDPSGTPLAQMVEGVALEHRVYPMADALAPTVPYWHLDVPGDVSLGLNADRAHRSGVTGAGCHVVMCDSGWEPHPYFVERGYRFHPTIAGPGAADPRVDENGHGTAESANVFAVAPDVDLTMVKTNFANSVASFAAAAALRPTVISCSWGSSVRTGPLSAADLALAGAIATAVANGIVVVFSAGNGHFGFPGQHPDVISAGGVFRDRDGSLRASDYASGFVSQVYPRRQSPDVCGLVGMRPRAAYIMLPLPEGCEIDRGLAGGTHPDGDQTTATDGWAAISGTSAAAPQLAGAVALLKQANPGLTPAAVRDVLTRTARDVVAGASHPNTGGRAERGPDTATGAGLVDVHKAVLAAKVRSLPVGRPVGPPPGSPVPPPVPGSPPPGLPPLPSPPPRPLAAADPVPVGMGLTARDIDALEQMVIDSDRS